MTPRHLLSLLAFFACFSVVAQIRVSGIVIDDPSKEPLPFVNIFVEGTTIGTSSGIDGKFQLVLSHRDSVTVSYMGYRSARFFPGDDAMVISLLPEIRELRAVEVTAGENPAHRIIRQVVRMREKNNPENLSSFSYKAYHKLFATAEGSFDTLTKKNSAIRFLENNYLFLNESYSERKFLRPNFDKETILGNRMTGVKDPFFAVLATNFQPFSFYKEQITLLDRIYVNPIANGTFSRYQFELIDTILHERDSTFIIQFESLPGKTFESLKGFLYVNTDGFALENVLAEPADHAALSLIKIQQKYGRKQGVWFPEELNTELILKEQKVADHPLKYVHRSYISEVQITPPLSKKDFGILNVEFDANANHQQEPFWNKARRDTLSRKEKNTYLLYDTLPVRSLALLNSFIQGAEAFSVGKFRAGKFYLPVENLLRKNIYENIRVGVGLQTSEKISKRFVADGYVGYGIKDRALKYGGSFQLNLAERKEISLKISYATDILEPGNSNFLKPPPAIQAAQTIRNWLTGRMDSVQRWKAQFMARPFRYSESSLFIQQSTYNPAYDYKFASEDGLSLSNYVIAEAGLVLKFVRKEHYAQIGSSKVITGFAYPHVDLTVSRALQNFLDGNFHYTRAELKIDNQFFLTGLGKTTFEIAGGMIVGNAPYSTLFNGKASNSGRFDLNSFVVPNHFQTMKIYEFTSDKYAYFFLSHNFGRLVGTRLKYFRPELALNHNMGIGDLHNPEDHQGIDIQTMRKGFFESGLVLSNLLRFNYMNVAYVGVGGGVFARYGYYAMPQARQNLVAKIAINLTL